MKKVFSKAIQGEKAQHLLEAIEQPGRWNLFQKIRKLDAKTSASFIRNEHPQTIAVVLAHLAFALYFFIIRVDKILAKRHRRIIGKWRKKSE